MKPIIKRILKSFFLLTFFMLFFTSCGSSRNAAGKGDMNDLQNLVASRDFEVQNDWAVPLTGSNVNLIGNPNYIRFKGDSVKIALPYFGERYSGGFNTKGGISYEGPARNFQVSEKANSMILEFEGQEGSENYNFIMTLFPNGKTTTSVNSSQRSTISYRGEITASKSK